MKKLSIILILTKTWDVTNGKPVLSAGMREIVTGIYIITET